MTRMRRVERFLVRWLSVLFPNRMANWLLGRSCRQLESQLRDEAIDLSLDLLLRGMDVAFLLCRDFRRNIDDFSARYVFRTGDDAVGETADFAGGHMEVDDRAMEGWTVRVTFVTAAAFRKFLFAGDQDILQSILANEVEVEGNLNYIYKFGFMARDLQHRLGLV